MGRYLVQNMDEYLSESNKCVAVQIILISQVNSEVFDAKLLAK